MINLMSERAPMLPEAAARVVRHCMDEIELIGEPVYPPFDELVTDAFNSLDDALATIRALLPEDQREDQPDER